MRPFDQSYLMVSTDALIDQGFDDAAEWMRAKIREEVDRRFARQEAVRRILLDCFGELPSTFISERDQVWGDPLVYEIGAWLQSVPRLFKGLRIRIDPIAHDTIPFTMRVSVAGQTFRQSGDIRLGYPISRFLDRCHEQLLSSLKPALELV